MVQEKKNVYSRITFIVLFTLVIILSYKIVASFLLAVIVGGLLAHALKPIQQNNLFKKIKSSYASGVIVFGLIVLIVIPLAYFIVSLIQQAIEFEKYLVFHEELSYQTLLDSMSKWPILNYLMDGSSQLQNQLKIWSTEFGSIISSLALKQATEIPIMFLQTLLTLISCYVFLSEGEVFNAWLADKIPLNQEIKKSLVMSFNYSSKRAVWATLAAALAQGLTMFIAYLMLAVPGAVLAAGATFIFAFIPLIGSAPLWIVGVVYLYLKGSYLKLILMVIFGIFVGIIDNIVRAFILKGPHGLHPLVALVAIFGGLEVFGFFGVLIGPIVIALLITMCEVLPQILERD